MAVWNHENIVLTKKGSAALSKVQAGIGHITITRAVASATYTEPNNLADEVSANETFPLSIVARVEAKDGGSIIQVQLNNETLTSEFTLSQIVVFAKHSDASSDEFLYLVAQADKGTADKIPLFSVTPVVSLFDIYLYNAHASNITVNITQGGLATVEMLNDKSTELIGKISSLESALEAHRKSSPIDHKKKSVTREHLADNVYTLPAPESANDSRFLRSDNTWQTITPNNIGAYRKNEVYSKGEIGQSFRKIGDKSVTNSVDWNTLTEPTTYKIQGATISDAHHAPQDYDFGILVVHRLENGKDGENRTLQIYYPHSTRGYWSRMLNGISWTEWRYIPTYNEVEVIANQKASTRISRSGDTMTGPLNFANNTWNRVGDDVFIGDKDRSGVLCIKSNSTGYTGLAFFKPSNEGDSALLYYNHDRNALFSNKWIGIENNVGGIYGHVYNNDSHWRLWGSDTSRPSTAYDIHGKGQNAEKGIVYIRKYVNGTEVVTNKIIAEDNNTYFQNEVTANTFKTPNWFRSFGDSGWYSESHGGGIWMQDKDWIRTYGSKNFYCDRIIRAEQELQVNGNGSMRFTAYNGGWYMQDNDWVRSIGNKNVYTGGKMKADAGFEGKATSSGWADGAEYSNRAVRVENDHKNMRFHWSGQGGQPTWLWGCNDDGENMYVYNPSNFTVSRANTAGTADNANHAKSADNSTNFSGRSLSNILGLIDTANTGIVESKLEENGYVKFRNGLIVQWGRVKENHQWNKVAFTTPYKNMCFSVQANVDIGEIFTNGYKFSLTTYKITKTSFSYSIDDVGAPIQWMSIGF